MKRTSTLLTALSSALCFLGLAALHLLWLFSPWPFSSRSEFMRSVLGTENSARQPTTGMTLLVAGALLAAAYLLAARTMLLPPPLPPGLQRWGLWCVASILLLRSLGGFLVSGILHLPLREFAAADVRLYSPLCLILGIAVGFVASDHSSQDGPPEVNDHSVGYRD